MQQYKAISIRIKDKATDTMHAVEHDHRLYAEAKNIPRYIDTSKTYMNQILFQHPEYPVPTTKDKTKIREYIQNIEERNKADFQRLKSEGKIAKNQGYQIKRPLMSGILTLSHEAKRELENPNKMEEFLAYAKNYLLKLADALGTDLLYAVLHMDETSPHIHFAMRNIRTRTGLWTDEKALGKSLSSTFYSMRSVRAKNEKPYQIEYSRLQDSLNFFNKIGFGRGVPRAERERRGEPAYTYIHRSVKQLHADLPKEVFNKKQELQAIDKEILNKKQELQAIDKEVFNKKQELQAIDKEILNKKQELQDKKKKIEELNKEIAEKEQKKWDTYNEILRNKAKVKEIQKQYNIIAEQMRLTEEEKERIRKEAIERIRQRLEREERDTQKKKKDTQANTNDFWNFSPEIT